MAFAAEKLIRSLSITCLKDMGVMLSGNVGKNYKDLAGKLGLSTSDVAELELTGKGNPGFALLQRWSQQSNTTVAVLMMYLRRLDRDDVVDVLNTELDDPVELVIYIKNKSILETINAFGSWTVGRALEEKTNITSPRSNLHHDDGEQIFERKVAEFKGKQLSFIYDEIGNVGTPIQESMLNLSLQAKESDGEFLDQFNLEVVIKNYSDTKEIFRGMVAADRCRTVNEALRRDNRINVTLSNLHCTSEHYRTSVLQQEVAKFRNKRLTFVYFDEPPFRYVDVLGYHPEADSCEKISSVLNPTKEKNGTYILRPSKSDPAKICITLVQNHELVNYKIHSRCMKISERFRCQYFLYEIGPDFWSVEELVKHYSHEELHMNRNSPGQCLKCPV